MSNPGNPPAEWEEYDPRETGVGGFYFDVLPPPVQDPEKAAKLERFFRVFNLVLWVGLVAAACIAMSYAMALNSGFRATKSVSQASSIKTPTVPDEWTYAAIWVAANVRSPFFAAASAPFSFMMARALALSPPAASSAFLHCMTDTPVSSRSSLIRSFIRISYLSNVAPIIAERRLYFTCRLWPDYAVFMTLALTYAVANSLRKNAADDADPSFAGIA